MKVLYYALFVILFTSCASAQENREASWRKYDFEWVKLRIKGPEKLYHSESKYDVPKVFMQLFPLKRPKFVIDDTIYRVKITIRRINQGILEQEKYRFQKSNLYKQSNDKKRNSFLWHFEMHEQFNCRDDGQYSYCRKDVTVENDELLSGEVEILNAGWKGQEERGQALKTVEIIMNSINSLE